MCRVIFRCEFYDYDGCLVANYLTVKNYTYEYSYTTIKRRLYSCFRKASKMLEMLNINKYDWELTAKRGYYSEETREIVFEETILHYNTKGEWAEIEE